MKSIGKSSRNQTVRAGDVLYTDFLPIPRAAMAQCGAASQTLAAIYRLLPESSRTIFARVDVIAEKACLPRRSVQRHVAKLVALNWLKMIGKERTGKMQQQRRTFSYTLTRKACDYKTPYAILPAWAARLLATSWAERAVFAVAMSRQHLLEHINTEINSGAGIEESYGRDMMTLIELERLTGLTRPSVCAAKQALADKDLIVVQPAEYSDGHALAINLEYRVGADVLEPTHKATVTPPALQKQGLKSGAPRPKQGLKSGAGRGKKPAQVGLKSGAPLVKKWRTEVKDEVNTPCSDVNLLKKTLIAPDSDDGNTGDGQSPATSAPSVGARNLEGEKTGEEADQDYQNLMAILAEKRRELGIAG